jgi:hypothetical protein
MTPPDIGGFPLEGVGALPNVSVAFPGEHWSNRKAAEAITPGEAVVLIASGGAASMRVAEAGDGALANRVAIALRTVQQPDVNTGPGSLGPNEIMNAVIPAGEYVHAYYSGAFHLTLFDPAGTYEPGVLVGWDADGARPVGKDGTGSWAPNAAADVDSIFEVMEFRPYGNEDGEGILTVRSLRGQF